MEYEVKVSVDNLEDIERKLKNLGAVMIDDVLEEDYYIDLYPCIDLKARDMALRIRIKKSKMLKRTLSELTFKGPKIVPDMKIRKEITVAVDDGRKLLEIFEELGFRYYVIKKHRKIYRYGPYKVFLDNVHGLGTFVEVEVEGVDSIDQFRNMIKKFVSILKISENFIVKSYLEMMLARVEKGSRDIKELAKK